MSPKPVDIDHALQVLKADGSTAEMRLTARQNLNRPSRSTLPKLSLVGLVATTAIFLMWPRATAGRTWAQVVQASTLAKITHSITRDAKGRLTEDTWRTGKKIAIVFYGVDGQVTDEIRSNGDRIFSSHSSFGHRMGAIQNPNAWLIGMVSADDFEAVKTSANNEGRLDRFLVHNGFEIVRQEPFTTSKGLATRYELREKRSPKWHGLVVVDEKSGLIVETSDMGGKYNSTFEYPQSVNSSIFEPRPQVVKNCTVYEYGKLQDEVRRAINKGFGKAKGITLRLVALDSQGTVFAIWTGGTATGRTDRPFIVPNIKFGKTWPLPKGSSWKGGDTYETTSDGNHAYGQTQSALTKIGDRIDISVPIKGGQYAKFKSVPVFKIAFFEPNMIRPAKKHKG